jgi:hypothetical protein
MLSSIEENLKIIQKYKIYFGHRSVGTNILKGVEFINSKVENSKLRIINIEEAIQKSVSFFSHSMIGENGKPQSKCDEFSKIVNTKFTNGLDIAFFKFCFADFNENSNINQEFEYYKQTHNKLSTNHPELAIIHVTVPLKSGSKGIKKNIKRIFNMEDWSDAGNIKRNEFNKLLGSEYDSDNIFDLAKKQSTYNDDSRESFKKNGQVYYSLINDYTTDGGHLNQKGGIFIANELILFLATYINKRIEN